MQNHGLLGQPAGSLLREAPQTRHETKGGCEQKHQTRDHVFQSHKADKGPSKVAHQSGNVQRSSLGVSNVCLSLQEGEKAVSSSHDLELPSLSAARLLSPKAVALHSPPCPTLLDYSRITARAIASCRSLYFCRLVAAAGRPGGTSLALGPPKVEQPKT